jgi:hypothetical protein
MDWDRLRYSGRELAREVTAKGDREAVVEDDDREAVNERGDRVAVNAVAIGYLDLGTVRTLREGRQPLRTGDIEYRSDAPQSSRGLATEFKENTWL